ncbi:LPS-assembly protein LptD [Salinisphaera sp. USBA-960]|nr:LPS-assembly protein LptD [Salifodinibacter halophilus]
MRFKPNLGRRRFWQIATAVGLGGVTINAAAAVCSIPQIPIAPAAKDKPPSVRADNVSLKKGVAKARGNARLTRNGQALEAPYVEYNRQSKGANAHGGVQYYKPGMFLTADEGAVNVNSNQGVFSDVKYVMTNTGGRGHADTVDSKTEHHFQLRDASYTTCPLDSPSWYLSATHVNLNRDSGRGSAWNTVMHLYGLPVFYTPYFNFPIDNKRHTGFLAPVVGVSGDSGFELTWPFYINIAPQYDLTLIPRYYGKRGPQLGAQARYQFTHQKGELNGQLLPNDQKYGERRSFVHYQHQGKFGQYVGFQADYNRASDDDYFDDLDDGPGGTSSSNLERGAELTFATTGARLDFLVQDWQTLNRASSSRASISNALNNNPYTRLPRVKLHLLSPTAPFRLGFDGSFTNFVSDNPAAAEARRYDAKPKLIWSTDHGGWFASSQAAYEFTHYDLSNVGNQTTSINRSIPSFQLRSGLRFTRHMHNGWIQTFNPQFQYLYTGYENQKNIRNFDSGVPALHFQRLFADNRFTGIDRIGDANQITLGATTRLYSTASSRTLAKLSFGRVTSFRDLKVTLPNTGITGYSNSGSDYVGSLTVSPIHQLRARGTVAYSASDSKIDRGRVQLLYASDSGYGINLGYRYYRGYQLVHNSESDETRYQTLKQVALGAYVPLGEHLNVVGRWNYSLKAKTNVESVVGVQYNPSCCVSARVSWRRYVQNPSQNNGNQHDSAIYFELLFQGLTSVGKTAKSFVSDDVFSGVSPGRRRQTYNTLQPR